MHFEISPSIMQLSEKSLESQTSDIKSPNIILSFRNIAIGAVGLVLVILFGLAVIYKVELFRHRIKSAPEKSNSFSPQNKPQTPTPTPTPTPSPSPSDTPQSTGTTRPITSSSISTTLINDPKHVKVIELATACMENNFEKIKLLLSENVDPNTFVEHPNNGFITTPLHIAIERKHLDAVNVLIERGADVNTIVKDGWSPLLVGCQNGHMKIVEKLLENGADVNATLVNDMSATSLHLATDGNHFEVAKILLENKALVDAKDKNDRTPLHIACIGCRDVKIVELLIEHGADVNAKTKNGQTPLMIARAKKYKPKEIIKVLTAAGSKL